MEFPPFVKTPEDKVRYKYLLNKLPTIEELEAIAVNAPSRMDETFKEQKLTKEEWARIQNNKSYCNVKPRKLKEWEE